MKRRVGRKPDLASRHLGIITQLSVQYWRSIPAHARGYYDVEEMIAETVMSIVKESQRYDSARAMESTFVHTVARNHLINVITRFKQQKRTATEMVTLEDWRGGSSISRHVKWLEAKQGCERVLQFASDGLKLALEQFFKDSRLDSFGPGYLEELQMLLRTQRVSRDDFAMMLKVVG